MIYRENTNALPVWQGIFFWKIEALNGFLIQLLFFQSEKSHFRENILTKASRAAATNSGT